MLLTNSPNRGFSLVELMVVVGLLGGVSLVVMNLTKQSTKSSTKYQFDSEIMLITNEINGIISDPNKCLTTFTNATQAASPALPVLNATPANVTNPTGIAGTPSTVRKYTLAGGPYGNGGVEIASYSLDLAATPDPLLTINFQNKSILGTGTIPKTIKLYVEKNGAGIITICRSLSTASVDIWSHGTGTDIHYDAGKVGIGTTTPAVKLDVAGEIRPGSSGIATGGTCANEGAIAYDLAAHVPVYCNNDSPIKHWAVMGGGGVVSGNGASMTLSKMSNVMVWATYFTCQDLTTTLALDGVTIKSYSGFGGDSDGCDQNTIMAKINVGPGVHVWSMDRGTQWDFNWVTVPY